MPGFVEKNPLLYKGMLINGGSHTVRVIAKHIGPIGWQVRLLQATHTPINQTLQAFPSSLSPLGICMRIFVNKGEKRTSDGEKLTTQGNSPQSISKRRMRETIGFVYRRVRAPCRSGPT